MATSYPQWSWLGNGPSWRYGPSNPTSFDNRIPNTNLSRFPFAVAVALLQKASKLIRRMQPDSKESTGSRSLGKRPANFRKMHRSHSNGTKA
jgi:hypothetical protein